MFKFNLKEAAIYRAVIWERSPVFRFANVLKKIFFSVFILFFSAFFLGLFADVLAKPVVFLFFNLSLLFLTAAVSQWLAETFLNSKLKKPALAVSINEALAGKEANLAEFLDFESAKIFRRAIKFAESSRCPEVNSSHFLYFFLTDSQKFNFILQRLLLGLEDIKEIFGAYFRTLDGTGFGGGYSDDFQQVFWEAMKNSSKRNHKRITEGDIITALAKNNQIFKKILFDTTLKAEDLENLSLWIEGIKERAEEEKRFWEYKNLIKKGSLAKEWAAGYTLTLDRFSIDLADEMKARGFPEIIGHKKEVTAVERILARRELNNVLLVGEPGVGRKNVIRQLAVKSFFGSSLTEVNYKRVQLLDISALLAHASSHEEAEGLLDMVFKDAVSAGNLILVINDFHNFVRTDFQPGLVDISGILSPYLALPQFQLVAICTYDGLHQYIERKSGLLDFFEKVEVSEISEQETLRYLESLVFLHERRYKKIISYPALRELVSYSKRYLPSSPFPKKAVELLDDVMVYMSTIKDQVVLPEHIAKIVTERTEIPVGELETKEKETLLNLESLIHKRIINQEEAVNDVSSALRRARAEITTRKGPMGAFLFLGPTGVGKTETSKALAEIYFGSEERMIRIDMSEFQNPKDISRLIGSQEGKEEGFLTTQVKESPFSLILLDEIEKAHPNILNLFLQVLDEGFLTDGFGKKVNFADSIIIATSNAGYQIILQALEEKTDWMLVKQKLLDFIFKNAIFRPEFINRFDGVVVFHPLSKQNLLDIAELILRKLKKNLAEKGVEFIITNPLKEKIVELGYDPIFGARQMKRVVQDKVENVLAEALLSGKLGRGYGAEIDPREFKLIIRR